MKIFNLASVIITILILLFSQTAYSTEPQLAEHSKYYAGIASPLSCDQSVTPVNTIYLYGRINNLSEEWPNYAENYIIVKAQCTYSGWDAPTGITDYMDLPASCETLDDHLGTFRCTITDEDAINSLAGDWYIEYVWLPDLHYLCPLDKRIIRIWDTRTNYGIPGTSSTTYQKVCGGEYVDSDGDLVPDGTSPYASQRVDNCKDVINFSQADSDHDKHGDACDNCINHPNYYQEDADGDGVGDACDNCKDLSNAGQADADNDGVGNACDNCPNHHNPGQEDSNDDGIGDACYWDKSKSIRGLEKGKVHKEIIVNPPIDKIQGVDTTPAQPQQEMIQKKVKIKDQQLHQ